MKITPRTFCGVSVGLGLLLSATGCATKPPCIHEAFANNPLAYRRVQVLPVVVTPAARPDKSLTTNDVFAISCSVSTNLVHALCQSLQVHGYEVVGEPAVIASPEDWSQFAQSCRSNLVVAYNQLAEASRQILARLQQEKGKLSHYELRSVPALACAERAAPNIDAFVMMRSTIYIESKMARNTRRGESALANTVGIAAAALVGVGFVHIQQSPSGVANTIAIIEPNTGNIFWWNSWRTANLNLADTNAVARTVMSMIDQLPASRSRSRAK